MFIKSNFIPIELYDKHIGENTILKNKHISIFNDYIPTLEELNINPYNILILNEPNELFKLHDWAIQNYQQFSCILTWGQDVLDKCENALLLPFGTSFLDYKDKHKHLVFNKKCLEISYICGSKKLTQGHHLRHQIYNLKDKIKIPLKWYYTTDEHKEICFRNSMFHLAIENVQNQNYFTEKIVDAFLTKTIPVYWGCPNIGEFFDIRGIYVFENENEAISIMNSLTEEDYYSKKEYIEKNYQLAIYYAEYFTRFADLLEEIININNI